MKNHKAVQLTEVGERYLRLLIDDAKAPDTALTANQVMTRAGLHNGGPSAEVALKKLVRDGLVTVHKSGAGSWRYWVSRDQRPYGRLLLEPAAYRSAVLRALCHCELNFARERVPRTASWVAAELLYSRYSGPASLIGAILNSLVEEGRVVRQSGHTDKAPPCYLSVEARHEEPVPEIPATSRTPARCAPAVEPTKRPGRGGARTQATTTPEGKRDAGEALASFRKRQVRGRSR